MITGYFALGAIMIFAISVAIVVYNNTTTSSH